MCKIKPQSNQKINKIKRVKRREKHQRIVYPIWSNNDLLLGERSLLLTINEFFIQRNKRVAKNQLHQAHPEQT